MANDRLGRRVQEAALTTLVPDDIAATLAAELEGPLQERTLRTSELARLAAALLQQMQETAGEKPE